MAETYLEVLSDFTNKPLEGQLADEELGRLLVPPDLAERDGTGPEAVGLLHTAGCSLRTPKTNAIVSCCCCWVVEG